MTRILIVDDEDPARQRVRGALAGAGIPLEIAEASNAIEAAARIRNFAPEIVFLDIEMPQASGLDLLRQLERVDFEVIFQTAHDEFALRAFELNACDYVLKPFAPERLLQSLARALERIASKRRSPFADRIGNLAQYLTEQKRYLSKFVVDLGERSRLVDAGEVLYVTSEDHVTYLHLGATRFSIDLSLNHLEENLDPEAFQRLHRNSIARVDQITGFRSKPALAAILKGGIELKVARDRQKAFRELVIRLTLSGG